MLMTDKSSRSIYTGDWTETDQELMSECRLWKYVICQAVSDAYLGSTKEKLEVSEWVLSKDFSHVCDLAEMNAENLQEHFKVILTSKSVVARYLGEKLKRTIQNRSLPY